MEENNGKKNALVVTTVASTLDHFCRNDISTLQKTYNIHVAANFCLGSNTSLERVQKFKSELIGKNVSVNHINMSRSPVSKENLFAYQQLRNLINCYSFEIIHCHTPIAAMLVRLAARHARKKGTKVIYTAHGFHFFKGAPLKNWLLYFPIEWLLSRYTDLLITINKEDYARAKKYFKAEKVEIIPGVGIDISKFSRPLMDRLEKRKELGLPKDSLVVLSVGELNKNKNHEIVIKAISQLKDPRIHYVICGQGPLDNYLKILSHKLGMENKILFLGYRLDVEEIYKAADIFLFPSKREGLGLAALEAMASGLPIITSNIHGIVDYSVNGVTGFTCNPEDVDGFVNALLKLVNNKEIRDEIGKNNGRAVKKFDVSNSKRKMEKIYSEVIINNESG